MKQLIEAQEQALTNASTEIKTKDEQISSLLSQN
jgi:hypothetical protein